MGGNRSIGFDAIPHLLIFRMHCHTRQLSSISPFRRSRHADRFRPLHFRRRLGTEAPVLPLSLPANRGQYFFRGRGNFIDSHADRIVDRIHHSRWNWQQRTLPNLFRSKWSVRIGVLYQDGLHVAHLESRRALVLEHRRKLVHHVAVPPVSHLFHQRFAQTHVDAAFDLAHHQRRVDGLADIVSYPHSLHYHDASFRIDIHFGHRSRIAVGRRRAHTRAFVFARGSRRRVRPYGTDHTEFRFSKLHRFGEAHAALSVFDIEHSTIRK